MKAAQKQSQKKQHPKCALCGLDRKLGKGHIVPAWAFAMSSQLEGVVTTYSYSPKDSQPVSLTSSHRSSLWITNKMLCITDKGKNFPLGCEQKLGIAEDELKKVLIDGTNILERKGKFPSQTIFPENSGLIAQAIAGILYKSYISERFFLTTIFNPESAVVPTLMQATNDPVFAKRVVKFFVVKYYSESYDGIHPETAHSMCLLPLETDDIQSNLFLLSFAGLCIVVKVDKDSAIEQSGIEIFAHSSNYSGLELYGVPHFVAASYIKYVIQNPQEYLSLRNFLAVILPEEVVNNIPLQITSDCIQYQDMKDILEFIDALQNIIKVLSSQDETALNSFYSDLGILDLIHKSQFWISPNIFNLLIDYDSHKTLLLEEDWLSTSTSSLSNPSASCVCGNKNRILETCCKRFWNL